MFEDGHVFWLVEQSMRTAKADGNVSEGKLENRVIDLGIANQKLIGLERKVRFYASIKVPMKSKLTILTLFA